MIDIKQAMDYFFYIIENSKYKITYICKDKQNIEIESENGISYFVSLDRTTSKWDYFNLYIKADRRYHILSFKVLFTPGDLNRLGTVKMPKNTWITNKEKYLVKKQQADVFQKFLCDIQYDKTKALREKLSSVASLLSESIKNISQKNEPKKEEVQDFKEKLAEFSKFIEEYENSIT